MLHFYGLHKNDNELSNGISIFYELLFMETTWDRNVLDLLATIQLYLQNTQLTMIKAKSKITYRSFD